VCGEAGSVREHFFATAVGSAASRAFRHIAPALAPKELALRAQTPTRRWRERNSLGHRGRSCKCSSPPGTACAHRGNASVSPDFSSLLRRPLRRSRCFFLPVGVHQEGEASNLA
jgi:hypothetical protein